MDTTITRNVYTYGELSTDAQERAIELLCGEAWEYLDSDMVSEEINGWFAFQASGNDAGCVTDKEIKNVYGVTIEWRVSYSQGDGAAIGGRLRREDAPNLAWPDGIDGVCTTITNLGWTRLDNIVVVNEDGDEDDIYNASQALWDAASSFLEALCRKLYRQATDLCETYTGKEYVLDMYENCYGNQRRFTVDGEYEDWAFWSDEDGGK